MMKEDVLPNQISRRSFIKASGTASLGIFAVSPGFLSGLSGIAEISPGKLDAKVFLNPGADYRGVPFFFFNDDIKAEEAVRQVREMKQAGWGMVMPRRYGGLMNATYGREWNRVVREVIREAKDLEMKVYLQEADKNGWYSAAPTEIPGMKDEYRNKFLIRREHEEQPGEHEVLVTGDGSYRYYQHTVYPRKGWENSFCYLDLLNKETVDSYLSALFTFLDERFGEEFGKTIEAVWVAEPHVMMERPRTHDTLPWTPKLPGIFRSRWGYSLVDNIPKLFDDVGDYEKVRYHYWRTLSDLILHSYSESMHEWCRKYNLKFTGHLMGEDDYVSQLQYSVNLMPHFEYMDIPGIDHLTMDTHWPTGDPFIFTPKQASSVANQMGKKEVLAEMYGCSDQGNSFEDRKNVFQWMAIMGINYRNYHGAFYSLRGMRKRQYPVNLNYQQPYWGKNRLIADYATRLSYLLRQGTYQADVMVLNTIESYYLTGKIARKLSKVIVPAHKNLIELSHNLLKIQRGFDYGDETILSKYGMVKDNLFVAGEMSYKVFILPSARTLRKSTLDLLNRFLEAGGMVLSTGDLPDTLEGEPSEAIGVFNRKVVNVENNPGALQEALDKLIPPAIRVHTKTGTTAEEVWVHGRKLDNGQLYYLTNTNQKEGFDTEILVRGEGMLEVWNPENGKIEPIWQVAKGTYIGTGYRFAPGGTLVLFHDSIKSRVAIPEKAERRISSIPVREFTVIREDPNSLTLDFCHYHKGDGNWSELFPIQGVQDILSQEKYAGPVGLQFEFTAESVPGQCSVVIEEADKYRITVNGQEVKYSGLPYYRDKSFLPVDITQLVRGGSNVIELSGFFEPADKEHIDNSNLWKFYGTELEQIYLTGDFGVKGEKIGEDYFECKRERFKPSFELTGENGKTGGNLLTDGYCFFNGTLRLAAETVTGKKTGSERYYLEMGDLDTVIADIRINGSTAGSIGWKPYRIDITDYVREGKNKIEIILTNSLRNLFGSLHYVPREDAPEGQWSQKAFPSVGDGLRWYINRSNNKHWSDDYFFRSFGVGKVSVLVSRVE